MLSVWTVFSTLLAVYLIVLNDLFKKLWFRRIISVGLPVFVINFFKLWFITIIALIVFLAIGATIWLLRFFNKIVQCSCCQNPALKSYQCPMEPKHFICLECLEEWIWAQNQEVKGTATVNRSCFNRCGAKITLQRLSEVLSVKSFNKYTEGLTRSEMSADRSLVWCKCGTVYTRENERGKCSFECRGCQQNMCAECGELKHRGICKKINIANCVLCPDCGIRISKIEGCDAVTCVMCGCKMNYAAEERKQKKK